MHPKNIVIKSPPFQAQISPIGFHKYAVDFINAASSLGLSTEFSPVPHYLYCRSIELALKSFLLAKGISINELKSKKLGHDLEIVLCKAKALGLDKFVTITSEQEQELIKANSYYPKKGFEYFKATNAVKGYPALPNLSVLEVLASNLISRLESVCLKSK